MNVENNVRYTLDLNDLMSRKLGSLILLTERLNVSVDRAKISYRSLANIATVANESMMVSSRKVSVAVMNMNQAFKSTSANASTKKLAKDIKDVANDSKQAVKNIEKLNTNLKNTNKYTKGTSDDFRDIVRYTALTYAKDKIVQFGSSVMETTRKVEEIKNQLNFAAGSVRQGGQDFEFAKAKSNELGLDMLTTAKAFARMSAAAKGTSYEGQGVRDIFESVSMASTVMHLSADETEGTMYALQQMMSKGKISAEELSRQLGNRFPGAVKDFAAAMKMTDSDFMEMMKKGQAYSADVLPKVAAYWKEKFSPAVAAAMESVTAKTNLMNNALSDFQYNLGESTKGLQLIVIEGLTKFYESLSSGADYLKQNTAEAKALGAGLIILSVGLAATGIAAAASTPSVIALAAALWATGIPLIALEIAALGGILVYAYNKFDKFRAIVDASVPTLINLGKLIYHSLVLPFKVLYHTYAGLFATLRGDFTSLGEHLSSIKDAFLSPWNDIKNGIKETDEAYKNSLLVKAPKAVNAIAGFTHGIESYNPNIESLSDYMKRTKGGKEKGVKGIKETGVEETRAGKSTAGVGKGYGHNIYININKLIETQNIKVENAARDFANNIAEEVSKALLLAVNDANRIATQ